MYNQLFSTKITSQSEPAPLKAQVKNTAGGYVFELDPWQRLDRCLILGCDAGTYYATPRALTRENSESVLRLIQQDGPRVVARVMEISQAGRAPRNDPALWALALAASTGNQATREAAYAALPAVARIGTHLFQFAAYREALGGWGTGVRRAVGRWYTGKTPKSLAYQIIKYQQRAGWSHRDLLRLSHPETDSAAHKALFEFICRKTDSDQLPRIIEGWSKAQSAPDPALIREYGLTREMLPTEWLQSADVWAALLEKMPVNAMVRNLGVMTANGLLKPLSVHVQTVVERLSDTDRITKARLHPVSVLMALTTYANGKGVKGSLTWAPVPQIVDALNEAFYLAFGSIVPTGKRFLLGIDVSGSMSWSAMNNSPLTAAQGAAAMAMTWIRTEPLAYAFGFSTEFRDLGISRGARLDEVMARTSGMNFGRTDCALPMMHAAKNDIEADVFVVLTDNETWAGNIHPFQALQHYRQKTGIPAKMVVVGMTATDFTIADPSDAGMLDIVGFDTAVPDVVSGFVA